MDSTAYTRGWKPVQTGDGWCAASGVLQDGRRWDTKQLCQAYIDGMEQGWRDAKGLSAQGPLASLFASTRKEEE